MVVRLKLPAAAALLTGIDALAAGLVTAALADSVPFAAVAAVCAALAAALSFAICRTVVAVPLAQCTELLEAASMPDSEIERASDALELLRVSQRSREVVALLDAASTLCIRTAEYRSFVPDLACGDDDLDLEHFGRGATHLSMPHYRSFTSADPSSGRPIWSDVGPLSPSPRGDQSPVSPRFPRTPPAPVTDLISPDARSTPMVVFPVGGAPVAFAAHSAARRNSGLSSRRGSSEMPPRRPSWAGGSGGDEVILGPRAPQRVPSGGAPRGGLHIDSGSAPWVASSASPRNRLTVSAKDAAKDVTGDFLSSPRHAHAGSSPHAGLRSHGRFRQVPVVSVGLTSRADVGAAEWRVSVDSAAAADLCYVLCGLYDDLSVAIRAAGGSVTFATGDSLIANWGTRAAGQDEVQLCEAMAKCAVLASERAQRMCLDLSVKGYPRFRLACGMAHGAASLGTVGGARFKTFAVCGKPPRDAAVCAAVAVEYSVECVVTSAFTGKTGDYQLRSLGCIGSPDLRIHTGPQEGVKIIAEKTYVYQLMTPRQLDELNLASYRKAYACVVNEDWAQAQNHLASHLEHQTDPIAERLMFIVRQLARGRGRRTSGFFAGGSKAPETDAALISVNTALCPLFAWERIGYNIDGEKPADDNQADSDNESEASVDDRVEQSKLFASVQLARRRQSVSSRRVSVASKLHVAVRKVSVATTEDSFSLTNCESEMCNGSLAGSPKEGVVDPQDCPDAGPLEESPRAGMMGSPRAGLLRLMNKVNPTKLFRTEGQAATDNILRSKVRRLQFFKGLTLLVLMYNAFLVPLRMGFGREGLHTTLVVANFVFDVSVSYVKIALMATTPFEHEARWVTDPRQIRARYARGDLFLDLLTGFPLEVMALCWERPISGAVLNPAYRINRVADVVRLPAYFDSFFQYWAPGLNPIVVRIQQFLICVFFLVHFAACVLATIIRHEQSWDIVLDDGRFFFAAEFGSGSELLRYSMAFDWAQRALTGYGHRYALTDLQVGFTLCICMIGVAVYATVIAMITSLVSSLGAYTDQYRSRMDELQDYINYSKMPQSLAGEILDYYRYLWKTQKTLSAEETPLNDLPEQLQQKINFQINCNVMRKVPLFSAVKDNDTFILDLVASLTLSVLLPESYIFRAGEPGDAMYFIGHGRVRIEDARCNPLADLGEGNFFGEVALLYGTTRTASVKALSYTHVYVLTKQRFMAIGQRFPECLVEVLSTAEARLLETQGGRQSLTEEQRQLLMRLFLKRRSSGGAGGLREPPGLWGRAIRAYKRQREREGRRRDGISLFRRKVSEAVLMDRNKRDGLAEDAAAAGPPPLQPQPPALLTPPGPRVHPSPEAVPAALAANLPFSGAEQPATFCTSSGSDSIPAEPLPALEVAAPSPIHERPTGAPAAKSAERRPSDRRRLTVSFGGRSAAAAALPKDGGGSPSLPAADYEQQPSPAALLAEDLLAGHSKDAVVG
eukprot:TRINITY_DN864_c2_g1_i1.p1 TRINITY_DN864_c2_g1~~TRINITY_DN864_c2_g1_i1.p1  ORF type:complete len:1510 (+),score=431.61 TRINITY_DN864_c2_g1_i1:124-4530(+)